MWGETWIIGTRTSGNEWPSWSDMVNISNYRTFNFGAHMGFWQIYTFFINVHDMSYISCSTNQTIGRSVWWTNYATQTYNWYETFIIKSTCLFCPFVLQKETAPTDTKALNVCHRSQNSFWSIFVRIPQHKKGCLVYVPSTQKIFSSHDVVFDKLFLIR